MIGTNSFNINTGNNTDIIGAVIANATNGQIGANAIDGGNLMLNTKTLTFANIYDSEKQKNSGFGFSTSFGTNIGLGINSSTNSSNTTNSSSSSKSGTNSSSITNNPNQDKTYYPTGSTLSVQSEGYAKEQTTKATIGNGAINIGETQMFDTNGNLVSSSVIPASVIPELDLQTGQSPFSKSSPRTYNSSNPIAALNLNINQTEEITKNTITGALNVSATIDNRLIATR